jgi:S-adenosyl-L-methionine hydrolase (adenosine-forming)
MGQRIILGFCLLFLMGCASQPNPFRESSGSSSGNLAPVVLMSDFGSYDDGIAICKGVMLKIQPGLSMVDITHQIPAFSVKDAARFLSNTTPYFPPGSVFVVLVERHVGKDSRPIVAKSKKGQFFVVADNGVLSLVAERDGLEKVRSVEGGPWLTEKSSSSTFAGRDIYAPIAAHLARGEDWSAVGPEIEQIHFLDKKSLRGNASQIVGEVVALDSVFGNLITDVSAAAFLNAKYLLGEKVSVTVGERHYLLPFVKTFDDVSVNSSLIYIDSTDHVAVAVNQGNFAERFKIKVPTQFVIHVKKEKK